MNRVLITGANRGIGLALCRELHERCDRITALCRQSSPGLDALGATVVENVDLTEDDGLSAAIARIGAERYDWLVLNAGVLGRESLGALDAAATASIRNQFELNALAPLRLVERFAAQLVDGGKIALITSRMGSIGDNTSGGYYGYRMSKAALNAAGKSLALDLAGRRIVVLILHPGFVRTDMTGGVGDISATDSARNLIARIDEAGPAQSGRFLHANGSELPW
jgi:NAD(P)-dependent dehydrogenase (short-subunit alcohol dehydrogenase family)